MSFSNTFLCSLPNQNVNDIPYLANFLYLKTVVLLSILAFKNQLSYLLIKKFQKIFDHVIDNKLIKFLNISAKAITKFRVLFGNGGFNSLYNLHEYEDWAKINIIVSEIVCAQFKKYISFD